jgi:hypothetical protein
MVKVYSYFGGLPQYSSQRASQASPQFIADLIIWKGPLLTHRTRDLLPLCDKGLLSLSIQNQTVRISLLQAVEAPRVARGPGSHIT